METSVRPIDLPEGRFVRSDMLIGFLDNLQHAIADGDQSILNQRRGIRVDRVVDVEEFAKSKEYLGLGGIIRPAIMDHLIRLFHSDSYYIESLCLQADTRVFLLDGTRPTIKELAERTHPGETFWILSEKDGRPYPAQATAPRAIKRARIWRVTFTDGSFVETDADHEFFTAGLHRVRVRDLSPGDHLFSAYCSDGNRVASVEDTGRTETVYCLTVPETGRFFVDVSEHGPQANLVLSSNCTGGIGIGKGFFAQVGTCYCLYLLGCLHNPQLEYFLRPGSSIYFIIQSKTEALARKAVFNELREMIQSSPWFANYFPFDKAVKTEMRFPGNVYVTPFGGQDTAALGLNVAGAILDELGFMEVVEDSERTRHTGEREYDQAERIYNSISRRIKSRFQSHGKVPGKMFLLSSANYTGDFTDRKCKEAETDSSIFVMKLSQWEALPETRFSGERFFVEVGSEIKQSQILESEEGAKDPEDVISVPIEYLPDFRKDINGALRDYAGISVGFRHPFIPYYDKIEKMTESFNELYEGRSLFLTEESTLTEVFDFSVPAWENLIDLDYIENLLDVESTRFGGHLDVGISGDAAGLSIGHIMGFTRTQARNAVMADEEHETRPIYCVDGSLRIVPSYAGEVDMDNIRDLIVFLTKLLNIAWFSADSFQSVQLLQSIRKAGASVGTLSVDTSLDPYMEYKSAIYEGRILAGSSVLAAESRQLEKSDKKVDHPGGGSKDVSDSVAGMVYVLTKKANSAQRSGRSRRAQQRMIPTGGRERRKARITTGGGSASRRRARRIS